jgi:hypothetical protein
MKYLLTSITIIISFTCFIKSKPPKGAVYVKTTISTQYEDVDTLVNKVLYTYYDSIKEVISNENTLESALDSKPSTSMVISRTGRKYVSALLTNSGDTTAMTIYLYDEKGNRTHNYQIMNGDTIGSQRRVYDEFGNSIRLYSKQYFSSEMYLDIEWEYDKHNNCIYKKDYDEFNNVVEETKHVHLYDDFGELKTVNTFTKTNKRKFKTKSKAEYSKNKIITYYFYDSVGYNYGIQLTTVNGGYCIETRFDNGSLKSLEKFDKKGNLLCSVYVANKKI